MAETGHEQGRLENRIKTYRWYYYIALTQFLMYFIVPMLIFPRHIIKDVEIISALTLGLVVGMFFLLTSVLGIVLDRQRRSFYLFSASAMGVYMLAALIAWSNIEHLDLLLR